MESLSRHRPTHNRGDGFFYFSIFVFKREKSKLFVFIFQFGNPTLEMRSELIEVLLLFKKITNYEFFFLSSLKTQQNPVKPSKTR